MTLAVRLLTEADLSAGDRIFRLAFGTQFGLTDPMSFRGDAQLVRPRFHACPAGALGAFDNGELVGSNFAARWGSFGVLGPLTVHPDCWSKGVAKALLGPTMDLFDAWKVRQVGLFTFPESTKHVPLYQRFGFWPQFLTALMSKAISSNESRIQYDLESRAPGTSAIELSEITGSIFEGLDLRPEVESIERQQLGETVLLRTGKRIDAFAACHIGKATEAGSGSLYIKFAAVRPGGHAAATFERLLIACEELATRRRCNTVICGVNTARLPAYSALLARGFRTFRHGVAMQRPGAPGYNDPAFFVIDDWR